MGGVRHPRESRDARHRVLSQMRDGNEVTVTWTQRGDNCNFTMTWRDGREVVAYWRPSDTPSDGLRLYTTYRMGFP